MILIKKESSFFIFLWQTITEHYKKGHLFFLFGFLLLAIFLNFCFRFEKTFLYPLVGNVSGILVYILFYGFAYFSLLYLVLKKNKALWKSKRLWLSSLGVILSLSLSATYFYISPIIHALQDTEHRYLIRKILVNSRNIFFVALPASFLWNYLKDKDDAFFWFSFKKIKFHQYLLFLFPVVLLAYLASFSEAFLETYPTFKIQHASKMLGIDKTIWALVYEFLYAFDFVWVEFLFRGILAIGLYRILGNDVIIPMVAMYCFLHFDKPLGEAISSVFGGYFLGVLAIYSRSIVGGCFLHIGVALSMDIFATMRL